MTDAAKSVHCADTIINNCLLLEDAIKPIQQMVLKWSPTYYMLATLASVTTCNHTASHTKWEATEGLFVNSAFSLTQKPDLSCTVNPRHHPHGPVSEQKHC